MNIHDACDNITGDLKEAIEFHSPYLFYDVAP